MNRWQLALASSLILSLAACGPILEPTAPTVDAARFDDPAAAVRPTTPPAEVGAAWIGAAPSQRVIVPGDGGPLWIGIWIDAPEGSPRGARAPMSLALVVDTSGSMAGDKIENARLAATSLLEALAPGDLVSIDTFANDVHSLAPPTVVGPATMGPLFNAVRRLEASGSTNLYAGLRMGEAHAASSPAHTLRRVIVISDGQANVGPSTAEALGDLAAKGTEASVQVSAIGVGLDYDERTLGELARRTSGRLYHLEEPSQLAMILDQEVRLLADTVATGAYLELSPAEGVEILGAEVVDARREGGSVRVDLGALYAGQRRELLFRARVRGGPSAEPFGDREIARARLVYQGRGDRAAWSAQTAAIHGRLSADAKAAEASVEPRVRAMVTRHEAADAQRRAAAMLNEGNQREATEALSQAERAVSTAASGTTDAGERARLAAQAARLAESRNRAQQANTKQKARETALESYGYSFSDDGLAAPQPSPSLKPKVR